MCLAVLARARGLHENDSGVNQMGELYNPYPKLPKNTRQIGERDQSVRLYLEDYVNTYLKRLFPKGGQDLRVGVLLGTSEEHDGSRTWIVCFRNGRCLAGFYAVRRVRL